MSEAPADMQGAASGALNLVCNLGFTTGTALIAAVYDTSINSGAGALGGLQSSFAVAAIIGVATLGLAIWLGKRHVTNRTASTVRTITPTKAPANVTN